MSKMLLSEEEASSGTGNVKPKVVNKSGLLMDWLYLLDPELSQANHEVKQKLLFAKSKTQQPSLKQTKNAILKLFILKDPDGIARVSGGLT